MKEFESQPNNEDPFDQFDQWIREMPLEETSYEFTHKVVAAALLKKKRRINSQILIGILLFLSSMMILCMLLMVGEMSSLTYLDTMGEWMNIDSFVFRGFISMDVFLMIEGVLVLLIMERVINSFMISRKIRVIEK